MANNSSKFKKNKLPKRLPFGWVILTLVLFYLFAGLLKYPPTQVPKDIPYSEFYGILKNSPDKIKSLSKIETLLEGEYTEGSRFRVLIPENDTELLNLIRQNVKYFEVKPPRTFLTSLLFNFGPVLLFLIIWWLMASRGSN